jgi:hypothetical protein
MNLFQHILHKNLNVFMHFSRRDLQCHLRWQQVLGDFKEISYQWKSNRPYIDNMNSFTNIKFEMMTFEIFPKPFNEMFVSYILSSTIFYILSHNFTLYTIVSPLKLKYYNKVRTYSLKISNPFDS